MLRAFDCAQRVTSGVTARAKQQGYVAVGRYYGTPGSSKLLTAAEAALISAAGLAIFTYFERTAGRVLLGRNAGQLDGALAMAQAMAVGQPPGTGICFAIDQDVDMDDPAQRAAVLGYFGAAKAQLSGQYRVGVYGDGEACAALIKAGLVEYEILAGAMGWQGSRAYRDGKLWEGMQYPPSGPRDNALGIDMDPVDLIGLAAVGAWTLAGPAPDATAVPPTPAPPTVTPADAVVTAKLLQQQLRDLGLYTGAIDGQIGPMSSAAAMRAYVLSLAR